MINRKARLYGGTQGEADLHMVYNYDLVCVSHKQGRRRS